MVEQLQLDLTSRETFFLSGDIHHYERLDPDKVVHVIAGGGGAFLHRRGSPAAAYAHDDLARVSQSRKLLAKVPWKLAGASGFLPHFGLLACSP